LKAQKNKIKGVLTTKFKGFAVILVRDTEVVNFYKFLYAFDVNEHTKGKYSRGYGNQEQGFTAILI